MGSKELAQLCENLSITDDDSEIHQISGGIERDGVEDVNHCLVGKVLAGKRVNREAFKSVIEQIWSPFGNVEIEVVVENIFMFYFNNPTDRDRIWHRGPWHFDRNLIVSEILEGTGNISQLSFNKAKFWVQIHDIPIMCMNRRMAKWLAEQIGEVIDIPSESRDCWGKFLRVKVLIDISRPLKRWLQLKLDQSENIIMVNLKYERLSEFCYACGRLGHSISECNDVEAKKEAIEGPVTRFGSWLRASSTKKTNIRSSSMGSGGTSEKERYLGESSRRDSEGSSKRVMASLDLLQGRSESPETVNSRKAREVDLESSSPVKQSETVRMDGMCVDRPISGLSVVVMEEAHESKKAAGVEQVVTLKLKEHGPDPTNLEDPSIKPSLELELSVQYLSLGSEANKAPVVIGKKWKRIARETQRQTTAYLTLGGRVQESCKRRVNFEVMEPERVSKKGKITTNEIPSASLTPMAEPVEQVCREP
ncbi:hypothetical protein EZV62_024686 [Acer yangbiense]|uniref:CCHC-type domain-containing protein n=1 Tax=Acer yangbiense TaxID=1000413 RepID=A0A5C7GW54_9ROSI|nr:hypothetical protein EZV62_024686 [Acer yangbiense]